MSAFLKCPGCEGPADPPARRCLKCVVQEWYRVAHGEKPKENLVTLEGDCRIGVYFTVPGVALFYRSNRQAAHEFAREAKRQCLVDQITIDDNLSPGLPRLPCEQLYSLV